MNINEARPEEQIACCRVLLINWQVNELAYRTFIYIDRRSAHLCTRKKRIYLSIIDVRTNENGPKNSFNGYGKPQIYKASQKTNRDI